MNLCLGERLDGPGWTGPPLGRFAPPGHGAMLPVAATQDTLFVWKDGASSAHVRTRRQVTHYLRHAGVLDVMGRDEEAFIAHDNPAAPGECLLVALTPAVRDAWCDAGRGESAFRSRFGFADPLLCEMARALERQCLDGEPMGRLCTESIGAALVACALARLGDRAPPLPPGKAGVGALSTRQQAQLVRYIEDRLGENLGLQELAAVAGYSPAHFLRLFRRTFGRTPHQFVLDLRVERAKRLLRGDSHSLAQIAGACGFADQSHFGSAFARRAGMPPGRFRETAARR